uniref:No apical meristem-associated C-terminal domain-containing protein n=1 Tax=Oryza brachyantha TaxID=4533 RepID=J3LER8_ORYBR
MGSQQSKEECFPPPPPPRPPFLFNLSRGELVRRQRLIDEEEERLNGYDIPCGGGGGVPYSKRIVIFLSRKSRSPFLSTRYPTLAIPSGSPSLSRAGDLAISRDLALLPRSFARFSSIPRLQSSHTHPLLCPPLALVLPFSEQMHPSRDSSLGFSPVGVSMNQASLHRRSTTGGQGEVALGRTDAQANRSEGGFDHAGVGLMRHRVAPPTQFDGRMPDEPIEPELEGNDFVHYFTNLLVNDQESHDLPPPSHTSNDDVPRASKGSQKRTKNFRDDEDRLLVSAWLNIGMDPIQGSDQPLGAYWRRIHQYFHANKTFDSDRTQGPLMNRWGVIQHDVNLFCGCLSKIETRNQSGWSVDDKAPSYDLCTYHAMQSDKFSSSNAYNLWTQAYLENLYSLQLQVI